MLSDENRRIPNRVQLPGGREIEVVYIDRPRQRAHGEPAEPLHRCFHCAKELVYPMDWSQEDDGAWRILLRCPDCEATREGVFERTDVEALDERLDGAVASLLSDLRCLTHANMTDEIDFFVRALEADLIVPDDF